MLIKLHCNKNATTGGLRDASARSFVPPNTCLVMRTPFIETVSDLFIPQRGIMQRRDILKTKATGLAAGVGRVAAKAQIVAQTFVLAHGAWHGGWCWSRVADRLRAAGHRVFTPTQTGLGERKHLLSKDNTLDTFTKDIFNVIEAEELSSVILVGHSFGGLAISGVADAMPDKLRHLDSLMVEGGKRPFDNLPPDIVAARRKAAGKPAVVSVYPHRRQRRSEFPMQKIPTGSNAECGA
jgi:pimeloyl-ACP methyl ester carboxylesterase